MFSTYKSEGVTILLKDISGMVEPLPTKVGKNICKAEFIIDPSLMKAEFPQI